MTAQATQSFAFVSEDADVCGVDEAGRGPLAGPVVAAAVVLDRKHAVHRATFAPVRESGAEHAR